MASFVDNDNVNVVLHPTKEEFHQMYFREGDEYDTYVLPPKTELFSSFRDTLKNKTANEIFSKTFPKTDNSYFGFHKETSMLYGYSFAYITNTTFTLLAIDSIKTMRYLWKLAEQQGRKDIQQALRVSYGWLDEYLEEGKSKYPTQMRNSFSDLDWKLVEFICLNNLRGYAANEMIMPTGHTFHSECVICSIGYNTGIDLNHRYKFVNDKNEKIFGLATPKEEMAKAESLHQKRKCNKGNPQKNKKRKCISSPNKSSPNKLSRAKSSPNSFSPNRLFRINYSPNKSARVKPLRSIFSPNKSLANNSSPDNSSPIKLSANNSSRYISSPDNLSRYILSPDNSSPIKFSANNSSANNSSANNSSANNSSANNSSRYISSPDNLSRYILSPDNSSPIKFSANNSSSNNSSRYISSPANLSSRLFNLYDNNNNDTSESNFDDNNDDLTSISRNFSNDIDYEKKGGIMNKRKTQQRKTQKRKTQKRKTQKRNHNTKKR
jgi:hypothetical protein